MQDRKPGLRWRLLLLLWVWALCVSLVVDLFHNVSEFDTIRPRAEAYRSARFVAHRMVGEPYLEDDAFGRRRNDSPPPSMRPRTILARLRRLETRPDASGADALLETRSSIVHDPELLRAYALAAASNVAWNPGREALAGRRAELALAALESAEEILALGDLDATDLRAARVTVERLSFAAPGYERTPPYAGCLTAIRTATDRFLATALESGRSSDVEIEALRLGTLVGGKQSAEISLRLLQHRSGRPDSAPTREAFLVQEHAVRAVLVRGDELQRSELAQWLASAVAQERDTQAQRRLLRHLREATRAPRQAPEIRDLATTHIEEGE